MDTKPKSRDEHQLNLLHTSKYSDFEIVCKDKTFKVHRAILAPQSTYFRTVFDSKFPEANQNRVVLDDVDGDTMTLALEYLYGGPAAKSEVNIAQSIVLSHTKLFLLADRLMIETFCKNIFEKLRYAMAHRKKGKATFTSTEFMAAAELLWANGDFVRLKQLFRYSACAKLRSKAWTRSALKMHCGDNPLLLDDLLQAQGVFKLTATCRVCEKSSPVSRLDVGFRDPCFCGLQGFCRRDCDDKVFRQLKCHKHGNEKDLEPYEIGCDLDTDTNNPVLLWSYSSLKSTAEIAQDEGGVENPFPDDPEDIKMMMAEMSDDDCLGIHYGF